MSYTKLNAAIKKYCKLNNIPYGYTVDNQEEGIKEYHRLRDIMVEKWKNEKKYKELISVAYGHWVDYERCPPPLTR